MPTTTIITGCLLILLGILGYLNGVRDGHASITALIPAFFGIVLVLLGYLAGRWDAPSRRSMFMHIAVLIGLIGFVVPAARLAGKLSELTATAAVISQAVMALICLVFVLLCVRSFITARRARTLE
jgi:hypothetical protein